MKKILQNLGLNEKEAQVYLAALELGEATGFQIYKKTALKKPTVYYILDELQKRNLISLTKKGNKKFYLPQNPTILKKDLEDKLGYFNEILPQLLAIYNTKGVKPKLKFYEGLEGLKEVFNDTLRYKSEILSFASEGFFSKLGNDFAEDYLKRRVKNNIPVRGIVPSTEMLEKKFIRKNIAQLRTAKLINEKQYNFPIEINIYGNKVAFMSFRDELSLIVESDEINKMMRMIFEFFWKTL